MFLEFERHQVLSTNRALPDKTTKVPGLQEVHGVSAILEAPAQQIQLLHNRRSSKHAIRFDQKNHAQYEMAS